MGRLPTERPSKIGYQRSEYVQNLAGINVSKIQKCFDRAMYTWSNKGSNGYQIQMMSTMAQQRSIPTNSNYKKSMEITINTMVVKGDLDAREIFFLIIDSFNDVPYQLLPYIEYEPGHAKFTTVIPENPADPFPEVEAIDESPTSEIIVDLAFIIEILVCFLLFNYFMYVKYFKSRRRNVSQFNQLPVQHMQNAPQMQQVPQMQQMQQMTRMPQDVRQMQPPQKFHAVGRPVDESAISQ